MRSYIARPPDYNRGKRVERKPPTEHERVDNLYDLYFPQPDRGQGRQTVRMPEPITRKTIARDKKRREEETKRKRKAIEAKRESQRKSWEKAVEASRATATQMQERIAGSRQTLQEVENKLRYATGKEKMALKREADQAKQQLKYDIDAFTKHQAAGLEQYGYKKIDAPSRTPKDDFVNAPNPLERPVYLPDPTKRKGTPPHLPDGVYDPVYLPDPTKRKGTPPHPPDGVYDPANPNNRMREMAMEDYMNRPNPANPMNRPDGVYDPANPNNRMREMAMASTQKEGSNPARERDRMLQEKRLAEAVGNRSKAAQLTEQIQMFDIKQKALRMGYSEDEADKYVKKEAEIERAEVLKTAFKHSGGAGLISKDTPTWQIKLNAEMAKERAMKTKGSKDRQESPMDKIMNSLELSPSERDRILQARKPKTDQPTLGLRPKNSAASSQGQKQDRSPSNEMIFRKIDDRIVAMKKKPPKEAKAQGGSMAGNAPLGLMLKSDLMSGKKKPGGGGSYAKKRSSRKLPTLGLVRKSDLMSGK